MIKSILNGRLVDEKDAIIRITDLALLRAYGIFDFFRLQNLKPLFLNDHLDRFYHSAEVLRLKCPIERNELKELIFEMLETNAIQNSCVRLVLTGGESPNGYTPGQPTVFAINEPMTPLPENHFASGIKLLSHEHMRDIPEVKTTNYLIGIYKLPELERQGAQDLLFFWEEKILEVTRSNFFIVNKTGEVITPGRNILKGITRKHVLRLAEQKYSVHQRDVYLDEAFAADEAFTTGTGKKVLPVTEIDGKKIGSGKPGPVTRELMKQFNDFLAIQNERTDF
jgi:branched-subunit amino acid aminotransferase/4-amino-4-deoxychorismate lyase